MSAGHGTFIVLDKISHHSLGSCKGHCKHVLVIKHGIAMFRRYFCMGSHAMTKAHQRPKSSKAEAIA